MSYIFLQTYDEKIRNVVTSKNNSEFGYLGIISNTKFTIYYVYTEDEREDDNEDKVSQISICSDKIWEVYVKYFYF